jgi:DNA-cytosine methyltransferase
MLASVDLFSGTGGFALALKGIATPIMFCDRDKSVIHKLGGLMASGRLPTAPIVDDVRDLASIKKAVGSNKVDIITAGFPCVGFSSVGAREGLKNEQSNLFHAATDVVHALKPRMVLFENVIGILADSHSRDMRTMAKRMHELGYSMRWTVCSAADVGARQLRNRWYCLATRNRATFGRIHVGKTAAFPACPKVPLITNDAASKAGFPDRIRAMGNAIVPLAGRLAFARLYSGYRILSLADLRKTASLTWSQDYDKVAADGAGAHGCSHVMAGKVAFHSVHVPDQPRKVMRIEVDPKNYTPPKGWVRRESDTPSDPLTRLFTRPSWPTPRVSAATPSHIITVRTQNDLSTLAMFVTNIDGVRQRKTKSGDCMDARWVEWIMGYPANWTL